MIKSHQKKWNGKKWEGIDDIKLNPSLCLIFGSRLSLEANVDKAISLLEKEYPNSKIVSVSTAGNILDKQVFFDAITVTCVEFEKTKLEVKSFDFEEIDSELFGEEIASSFDQQDLALVLLFSTSNLNAGNLIDGINKGFDNKILVSGGVAGDGVRFEKTLVGLGKNIKEDNIIAIGFYSQSLKVTHGSKGGWNTFGPPRIVTKSEGNILLEIDHKPVLDLYKEYLGPKAKELPGAGLLFPFALIDDETNEEIVRGIQGVSEEDKSITLFGNVKNGQQIRLMRANHSILIDGAADSAKDVLLGRKDDVQLAILVSCVARRLALDQLIEEEIEEVKDVLGESVVQCGFYSYSEFSPTKGAVACSLHNQTMTITALSEV